MNVIVSKMNHGIMSCDELSCDLIVLVFVWNQQEMKGMP
jgi:hypothetical protein